MSSYFDKKEKQMNRDNKASWRDIDAKKDGKNPYRSSDHEHKKTNSHQEKQKQSQAKKALDELFKPKKNPAQSKAWKSLAQAKGREFQKQALLYIESHGLPRVWDDLITLLDIEDEGTLLDVLAQIQNQASEQNTAAKTLACAKLRIAKLNHEDPDIHEAIDALINTLS
ncbi:hypothetical protein MRY82_10215 [bacterium]|nr:hypothetical protein [bacterium]